MIPFLCGDLFKLLKNIFSIIFKPDAMNKCETALKLREIDLYSSANYLVAKDIDIGFVALTHMRVEEKRQSFKNLCFSFQKSVRKCVVATVEKIIGQKPSRLCYSKKCMCFQS